MSYRIVRFYKEGELSEVIKRGLTLEEAKAHCQSETSRGENFFDGYTEE